MNKKEQEMREEARAAIIETLRNGYTGYYCDLHQEIFNSDYYIIGTYQAKEALKEYDVFDAIEKVQQYEIDNFGGIYTDLSDPEKLINMLWYIIGEEVLYEIMEDVNEFHDNWNNRADEKTNAKILKAIIKKEILQKAKTKIQEEIEITGFIDDSDNVNRFLDNLIQELTEEALRDDEKNIDYELQDELLEEIKKFMNNHYKHISTRKNGNYVGFYYKADKEFNNLDEFYNYFGINE